MLNVFQHILYLITWYSWNIKLFMKMNEVKSEICIYAIVKENKDFLCTKYNILVTPVYFQMLLFLLLCTILYVTVVCLTVFIYSPVTSSFKIELFFPQRNITTNIYCACHTIFSSKQMIMPTYYLFRFILNDAYSERCTDYYYHY